MNIRKVMILILSLVVFLGSIFYWIFIKDSVATKKTAEQFFAALAEQDYKEAFMFVDYYEFASDISPTIDYGQAQKYWIEKVEKMNKQGIVLKDFNNIKTYMDDNYPQGSVELTLDLNKRLNIKQYIIHFSRLRGEWRVSSIQGLEGEGIINTSHYEKAISGFIPIPRSLP